MDEIRVLFLDKCTYFYHLAYAFSNMKIFCCFLLVGFSLTSRPIRLYKLSKIWFFFITSKPFSPQYKQTSVDTFFLFTHISVDLRAIYSYNALNVSSGYELWIGALKYLPYFGFLNTNTCKQHCCYV